MTRQERQVQAVAKKLIKTLDGIESYDGDPSDLFADAEVQLVSHPKRKTLMDLINRLKEYYAEE
jgi:hypothetical protein